MEGSAGGLALVERYYQDYGSYAIELQGQGQEGRLAPISLKEGEGVDNIIFLVVNYRFRGFAK